MKFFSSEIFPSALERHFDVLAFLLLSLGGNVYGQGPYTADNDRPFVWRSSDLPSTTCLPAPCVCTVVQPSTDHTETRYAYSPSSVVSVGNTTTTSRNSRVNRIMQRMASPFQGFTNCIDVGSQSTTLYDANFTTVNFVDFESNDLTHSFCAGGSVNLQSTLTYTNRVTWSGTGVNSSGVFSHSTAGTYNPVATRVFDNGTSTITFTVTVNAFPSISFSAIPNFCQSRTRFDIYHYTNVDAGSFSSSSDGVFDTHYFNPSTAGVGTHTINWSRIVSGCTSNTSTTVSVDASITVDAGANQAACDGSGDIALIATTSGVSWSCVTAGCTYLSGGKFDTDAAPSGTYTVRASKSNGTCSDTNDKPFRVHALPTINAGPDLVYCIDDGIQTLTGGSPTQGNWSASCGACVSGSSLNLTLAGVGSHTITYTAMDANSCTNSNTRSLTINSLPDETAVVVNSPERCGSGPVTFNASLTGTNTFNWFGDATGGTTLHTGASYSPNLTNTTTFYVEVTNSVTCVSANRKEAVGIVHPVPVPPVAPATPRCGPGPITLNASGGIANATYRWYENDTGGVPLDTGPSFSTTVTSTRSFYVDVLSDENCVSPSRTEVVVTVNPVPGVPTTFPNAICGAEIVPLSVGGTPAGGDYRWYPMESGGASFENSNTFNAAMTETTSYWVSIVTAENCEGPRQEIVATINTPPVPPVGTPNDRCGPGPISISASGAGVTFDWYATEFSSVSLFTGQNYQPTITVSTSFWVETTDINNCTSLRTKVDGVVFDIPVDATVPAVNRCGPGPIDIVASGSGVGAIYDWFDSPTGGSSVFTDDTFQPTVVTSRSYYVSATSADGCPSPGRTQVFVTVNAIPSQPLINHNSSCGAGPVDLTVGGAPAGGDYRWYPTETGGSSFNNTSSFDANIAVTESYWVSIVSAEDCEGSREEIFATIYTAPDPPIGVDDQRCGPGSLVLSVNAPVSGTFNWYATELSVAIIFTGPVYNTPNLSVSTSFWVDITDSNTCVSPRTEINAVVDAIPLSPTSQNVSNCGPGQVSLIASGSGAGAKYKWFNNATGGASIFEGETFEPTVTTTRNFYVQAETLQTCISVNRTQVIVPINFLPAEPLVFGDDTCGEGRVDLSVGGTPAGGEYRWYTTNTGGISFNNTNGLSTIIVAETSFWVSIITAELCEGPREEIIGVFNDPPLAPTGNGNSRCGFGSVTLSASSPIAGSFNWYETRSSQVSLATSVNFPTPDISVTTGYWVDITDANGCTSPRTETFAVVNDLPAEAVVPTVSRCGPGQVTINAGGSVAGATYEWFENPTGGLPINIGPSYITTVTVTRNFYVSAVSPENCVSANRTTVTVSVNAFPGTPTIFNNFNCGFGVVSLAVGGASAGGEYRWYLAQTGGISFNNRANYDADITETEIYWVSIITAEGCEGARASIDAEIFDIPLAPTGNGSSRCGPGAVIISASNNETGTFNWYATQASQVIIFTGPNYTTPSISVTTTYWAEFVDTDNCISPRTEVSADVLTVIPDPTAVPPVQRCGTGQVSITASSNTEDATFEWYDNQFGGSPFFTGPTYITTLSSPDVFYVLATSPEGCESTNRTPANVTINPLPSGASVTDGSNCGSGQITMMASGAPAGGDYNWYETDNSFEVIATGNEFTTPVLVNTRSYFVSIVNQFNCQGQRSEVVAEVNLFPERPTGEDEDRCGSGDVTLTVSTSVVNPTVNWYFADQGGTAFANGLSVTISDLTETTIYYASVVTPEGCESTREAVTATINPIIPVDIGANITLCLNAGTYDLSQDLPQGITIADGFFLGAGVIDTDFHPSIANIGNKEITFSLQTEIGCMTNGTRFTTVIDVKENGEELEFSENEITYCINGGLKDLTGFPNIPGGSWSMNAAEGSINVGVVDPLIAGQGEFIGTYQVEVNGCTVIGEVAVNITAASADPEIEGSQIVCIGQTILLEISGASSDFTYRWYDGDDLVERGREFEVTPQESITYSVEAENPFGCLSNRVDFSVGVVNVILDFTATPLTIEEGGRVEFATEVQASSYTWDFGDTFGSAEQNPSKIYFTEGVFEVGLSVVTNESCELAITKEDLITVTGANGNVITGIDDDDFDSSSSIVYPQPFSDRITMKIQSNFNQVGHWYLFSMTGDLLMDEKVNLESGENEIEIDSFNNISDGIYLLKLVDENSNSYDHLILKKK